MFGSSCRALHGALNDFGFALLSVLGGVQSRVVPPVVFELRGLDGVRCQV